MSKGTCSVPDCINPRNGADYCRQHRNRLRTWGSVRADVPLVARKRPLLERIAERYTVNPDTECWEWDRIGAKGYGRIQVESATMDAHRASYLAHVGTPPEGVDLDHVCRVKHCVNPQHLRPIPHQGNMENLASEGIGQSGVRGVSRYVTRSGGLKWRAKAYYKGQWHDAGVHATVAEAAEAVKALRLSLQVYNEVDRR